jgi:hypothetical protein
VNPRIIVPDHLVIALEDGVIRDVEAHDGRVQSNIGLGDLLSEQVRLVLGIGEMGLDAVEGFEQLVHIRLVGGLRGREAGLVNSVVDRVVYPGVHLIDVDPELLRVIASSRAVHLTQLGGQQLIKCTVEHPDDLAALVVDDGLFLLVPQHGYGVAARVGRVRFEVQVLQVLEAVERILVGGSIFPGKKPAIGAQHDASGDYIDDALETLQRADEVGAVRPWTAQVQVENVAVLFGGELGVRGRGDNRAEDRVWATELAISFTAWFLLSGYYQGQYGYVYFADREGLSETVPPTPFGCNKYYTNPRRITNSASLLRESQNMALTGRKNVR